MPPKKKTTKGKTKRRAAGRKAATNNATNKTTVKVIAGGGGAGGGGAGGSAAAPPFTYMQPQGFVPMGYNTPAPFQPFGTERPIMRQEPVAAAVELPAAVQPTPAEVRQERGTMFQPQHSGVDLLERGYDADTLESENEKRGTNLSEQMGGGGRRRGRPADTETERMSKKLDKLTELERAAVKAGVPVSEKTGRPLKTTQEWKEFVGEVDAPEEGTGRKSRKKKRN